MKNSKKNLLGTIAVLACTLVLAACSKKVPSEIRTYRELFNYSATAMKAYKDSPSEYVSLLKDAITVLGDELDEDISKKGETWTDFSDEDEIGAAVLLMYFALGSMEDEAFDKKYEAVDADDFFNTLEKAFTYYGEKYYKPKKEILL